MGSKGSKGGKVLEEEFVIQTEQSQHTDIKTPGLLYFISCKLSSFPATKSRHF